MKKWVSKDGKHFWYLPLSKPLILAVFFSLFLRLGDIFSTILLSALANDFHLKCTGRFRDKDDPFVDWMQQVLLLKRTKTRARAQPCQGWGRQFVDYFLLSSIIRRLFVKKSLRTGVSLIKPNKKVVNNAGNTTSSPPPVFVGIHSYQEGGANTDKPKNRAANIPKRTESLFTTRLFLLVERRT